MERNKKICHVLYSLNFGGIQKLVYDLVKEQIIANNYTPSILVCKEGGHFSEKFNKMSTDLFCLRMTKSYIFNIRSILKIYEIFKNNDVIHFHDFNPIIILIAYFLKKKIIYTEHGNFAFGRKKRNRDLIILFLRKCYFKFLLNNIVANSDFTKKYLCDQWKINEDKIKIIHNGVIFDKSSNKKNIDNIRSKYKNKYIIGTTSRLVGFKRVDRLIKAFQLLIQNQNDSVLLIVGDGTDKSKLEGLVKDNKIKNVHFLGYKENVFDYQSSFDLCVFPSQNEPFGLVAVESYLASKPTIVFRDGGGLKEIISIVNESDIVSSIEELVQRIKFYKDKGIKKVDNSKILEHFTAKRMTDEYLNLISKIG